MALYSGKTLLLLHANGVNGATAFTDEAGRTITASGSVRISTAQSKFGGSSAEFYSTGGSLTITGLLKFGNETTITWEAWVYPLLDGTVMTIFGNANSSAPFLAIDVNAKLTTQIGAWFPSVTAVTSSVWQHVALVKRGSEYSFYINGVNAGGGFSNSSAQADSNIQIGIGYTGQPFKGWVDDVRITSEVTDYLSNFAPPTAQLGLISTMPVYPVPQSDIATVLAKYDPSQPKPAMALLGVDLSDRLPYGIASDPVPWEFKGHGKVTGTVKNTPSTPVYRLLRLYREPGGMLVASGWSDPVTGAYSFTGLNMRYRYTVISFDHTGTYRAVIADNQTPELMP